MARPRLKCRQTPLSHAESRANATFWGRLAGWLLWLNARLVIVWADYRYLSKTFPIGSNYPSF